jgi:hypothetical protein
MWSRKRDKKSGKGKRERRGGGGGGGEVKTKRRHIEPNTPAELELQLPNQWLWDIVDEFIYQFQSFAQYRSKLKSKSDIELGLLKAHPEVWNVTTVIGTLSALIAKSKIVQMLENEKKGEPYVSGRREE